MKSPRKKQPLETPHATERGMVSPVLSFEQRKWRLTARSHFLRRVRRLPKPSKEELAEIIRNSDVPVTRYASGVHLGWRPAIMREA